MSRNLRQHPLDLDTSLHPAAHHLDQRRPHVPRPAPEPAVFGAKYTTQGPCASPSAPGGPPCRTAGSAPPATRPAASRPPPSRATNRCRRSNSVGVDILDQSVLCVFITQVCSPPGRDDQPPPIARVAATRSLNPSTDNRCDHTTAPAVRSTTATASPDRRHRRRRRRPRPHRAASHTPRPPAAARSASGWNGCVTTTKPKSSLDGRWTMPPLVGTPQHPGFRRHAAWVSPPHARRRRESNFPRTSDSRPSNRLLCGSASNPSIDTPSTPGAPLFALTLCPGLPRGPPTSKSRTACPPATSTDSPPDSYPPHTGFG